MTSLIIFFIVVGLVLYGLQEFYQIKLGIRPRKTPDTVIMELANILRTIGENGRFIDLGSGYGHLIFGLAKRLPGWEFIGVEQSPTPWLMSNILSVANNYGNYRFYIADSNVVGLKNYDVIFIDQNASILKKWEANLARRLEPGTLLFTLNAQLPRVKFREKMTIDDVHTLYLYQKAIPKEEVEAVTDTTTDTAEPAVIPA